MKSKTKLITAEEFARMPEGDCRQELINGTVVTMAAASRPHARVMT